MITWSHTKLSTFLQCPYKFREVYITKTVKSVQTEAMREGNEKHKSLEDAVNQGDGLPDDLAHLAGTVHSIRERGGIGEEQLGVRRDWSPCSFFAKDVWGRCKVDVQMSRGNSGVIIDWKTGQLKNQKYSTADELKLHALIFNAHRPELKVIRGAYCWTRDGSFTPKNDDGTSKFYDLSNFAEERNRVEELMGRIEMRVKTDNFSTRKNNLCPWCEVKHCKYYKPKDAAPAPAPITAPIPSFNTEFES